MAIDYTTWSVGDARDKLPGLISNVYLEKTLLIASYALVGDVISMCLIKKNNENTPFGKITLQNHVKVLGLEKPFQVDDWGHFLIRSNNTFPFNINALDVVADSINRDNARTFSSFSKRCLTVSIVNGILQNCPPINVNHY